MSGLPDFAWPRPLPCFGPLLLPSSTLRSSHSGPRSPLRRVTANTTPLQSPRPSDTAAPSGSGDERQAIFSWRGSTPHALLAVARAFGRARHGLPDDDDAAIDDPDSALPAGAAAASNRTTGARASSALTLSLTTCFRSSATIVDAANAVVRSQHRRAPDVRAAKPAGPPIVAMVRGCGS